MVLLKGTAVSLCPSMDFGFDHHLTTAPKFCRLGLLTLFYGERGFVDWLSCCLLSSGQVFVFEIYGIQSSVVLMYRRL